MVVLIVEYIKLQNLNRNEVPLVELALSIASKSVSKTGRKVGCIILCEDGKAFEGTTNEHARYLGSTCAERMAVDQLYKDSKSAPQKLFLTGYTEDSDTQKVLLPCGCCRELLFQTLSHFQIDNLQVISFSWDKSVFLKTSVRELFPVI